MDFSTQEITVAIETIGQRNKWFRKNLAEEKTSAKEKALYSKKVLVLDSLLKKFADLHQLANPVKASDEDNKVETKETKETKESPTKDCQILIVDDDEVVRQMIKTVVGELGFENFEECADGHDAIALIKGKAKPFDMVFCDWRMPTVSGLDVLKVIRQVTKLEKMPFIMVTGMGDVSNIQEAKKAGVTDYIVKPIDGNKLQDKMKKYIKF